MPNDLLGTGRTRAPLDQIKTMANSEVVLPAKGFLIPESLWCSPPPNPPLPWGTSALNYAPTPPPQSAECWALALTLPLAQLYPFLVSWFLTHPHPFLPFIFLSFLLASVSGQEYSCSCSSTFPTHCVYGGGFLSPHWKAWCLYLWAGQKTPSLDWFCGF